MSEEIKYELFAKKLSDSLLEGEEKILRDWINESVENATEYAVAKQAWSAVENFEIETNTQDAWQKLQNSISVEENKNNKNWKTRYFTIAASLLLLIGLGGGIWRMQSSTPTLYTADETTKKVILSDGSIVWLNAHSSLSVPTNFAKAKKREVSLTGEAFFEVVHDQSKCFSVFTQNIVITDIGTQFNVSAFENEVAVSVAEGEVELSAESQKIALKVGESAAYNRRKKTIEKTEFTKNFLAWKTEELIFENTPLPIVARDLEKYYNIKINIKDTGLMKISVTATLKRQPQSEAMKLLESALGLRVVRDSSEHYSLLHK